MSPIYFSGFFYDSHKAFSPIFIAFFILCLWHLLRLKLDKKASYLCIFPSILAIILLVQSHFFTLKYGFLNELVRHIFSFFFLMVALGYIKNKNKNEIQYLMHRYIDFNILLLLAEMLYRVLPQIGMNCSSFYCFKYNSFIYADSNFTALHILSIICLLLFNKVEIVRYQSAKWLFLLVLLFFTFSRTAYVIFFVLLFIRYYRDMGGIAKLFCILLCSISLVCFLYSNLFQMFANDNSFKTKLYLYNQFLMFFNQDPLTTIFGYGSGNLIDVIGRESHNIYGLIMEMGFLWLVLMLAFYCYLYWSFGAKSFLILLPVILSGLVALYPLAYLSLHFTSFVLFYRFNYLFDYE